MLTVGDPWKLSAVLHLVKECLNEQLKLSKITSEKKTSQIMFAVNNKVDYAVF